MGQPKIHFFSEEISFSPKQKTALRSWIQLTIEAELQRLKELNFIFCNDAYLLKINQQFLNHDTYTDIITFDNSEESGLVVGDIFISVERVQENAEKLGLAENEELHRVMIHGVLHLLGYTDKGKDKKAQMTEKENQYLGLRKF
ncbi:MAG: rRNA maturation RNase YbeY [Sphingobacteriaceae bacterium]